MAAGNALPKIIETYPSKSLGLIRSNSPLFQHKTPGQILRERHFLEMLSAVGMMKQPGKCLMKRTWRKNGSDAV